MTKICTRFLMAPVCLLLLYMLPISGTMAASVLVEAESFTDKGGWVVDPQFADVMGSPFLMAHGLGKPVADAATKVNVPQNGRYRVLVRTRNWVPGEWTPPGRFQVLVNGSALKPEFGTQPGWAWQDGGTVNLSAGRVTLALHDLTGFNGRCDAILLTTELGLPPNDPKAMRPWRNRLLGMPDTPEKTESYDVVIVGGGVAGCAAAIAAGEQGLNVALIHDRETFGGNASGEVRVNVIGIKGREPARRILDRLTWQRHGGNGSPIMMQDDIKRNETMKNAVNVTLVNPWRAYDVTMDGKKIRSVQARHIETGECRSFTAPIFIDCTGDGWIGFWSGAEFRYGREAVTEFEEHHPKNKNRSPDNLWSPKEPDNRVMGSTLMWGSGRKGKWIIDGDKKTFEPDPSVAPFPEVPWATVVAKDVAGNKNDWYWEYTRNDLHQINDAEYIRDYLLRVNFGAFSNYSKKNPGSVMHWCAYILGKRESRRLIGDYIFTLQDIWGDPTFKDGVVKGKRGVDLHFQTIDRPAGQKFPWNGDVDWTSWMLSGGEKEYEIPYRCLYSRNIENLLMAGRCFSTSHVALGGPRIMNVTGQMGVAVGYAASLCKKYDTSPRRVYEKHLAELRELTGFDESAE
jgi:hypothetical protein